MTEQTILIIDDDTTITSIVEVTLEKNGFKALSALNGKEGLAIVENEKPDAIILDKMMPEMDGNEVLENLKKNPDTQDIPVMMLTSKNHIVDIAQSLEMGANDYIVKPFDDENLVIRLKNMLR